MEYILKCPVCGEDVEFFDICETCGWQNRGIGETDDGLKGPNCITLSEARELYKQKMNGVTRKNDGR